MQLTKVLYIQDEPVEQKFASDQHALFQIKPSFQTAWSLLQDLAWMPGHDPRSCNIGINCLTMRQGQTKYL